MMNGVVLRITGLSFTGRAADELSKASWERINHWISHQTGGDMKLVFAADYAAAVNKTRDMIMKEGIPSCWFDIGLKPHHIEVKACVSEVNDGLFWQPTGSGHKTFLLGEQ